MRSINFSINTNGKLFADTFGDVRPMYAIEFKVNEELEATYNEKYKLGIVKPLSIIRFPFMGMKDYLSLLDTGKPVNYYVKILKSIYDIEDSTVMARVVYGYVMRDIETQTDLMNAWWAKRRESQKQYA